jgi:hypothetical protein
MSSKYHFVVITEAFWDQFGKQTVFPSIWDMIAATPAGVRDVHVRVVDDQIADLNKTASSGDPTEEFWHTFDKPGTNESPRSIFENYPPNKPNDPRVDFSRGVTDDVGRRWEHGLTASTVLAEYMDQNYPISIPIQSLFSGRVALTVEQLHQQSTHPIIVDRAQSCSVKILRVMPKFLRWRYAVDCGNGPHVVKLKVEMPADRRIRRVTSGDLRVSCSCPFWVYYGSEYHAKELGYLDGRLRGTGAPPDIRDPTGKNLLCKHAYAVISRVLGQWKSYTVSRPAL